MQKEFCNRMKQYKDLKKVRVDNKVALGIPNLALVIKLNKIISCCSKLTFVADAVARVSMGVDFMLTVIKTQKRTTIYKYISFLLPETSKFTSCAFSGIKTPV